MVGNIKHVIHIGVEHDNKEDAIRQSMYVANLLTRLGINVSWSEPTDQKDFPPNWKDDMERDISDIDPKSVMAVVGAFRPVEEYVQYRINQVIGEQLHQTLRLPYPYPAPIHTPSYHPPLEPAMSWQTGKQVGWRTQPHLYPSAYMGGGMPDRWKSSMGDATAYSPAGVGGMDRKGPVADPKPLSIGDASARFMDAHETLISKIAELADSETQAMITVTLSKVSNLIRANIDDAEIQQKAKEMLTIIEQWQSATDSLKGILSLEL